MLQSVELRDWLFRDLPRLDKMLLILATFDSPKSVSEIKFRAQEVGFRTALKWNISQTLGSSNGKAIRTPVGWQITNAGKTYLQSLGVSAASPAATQVALDLRKHLAKITNPQTREFVEEAIKCHEAGLYRSAIVMSWLGAMDVLHRYVHTNHLSSFNSEATRVFGNRWKKAVSTDDLGRMKEADFLDRIEAISLIGKNVKTDLKSCLDRRNGCGHPNSLRVGVNQSAAHMETLLLNVFDKFSS